MFKILKSKKAKPALIVASAIMILGGILLACNKIVEHELLKLEKKELAEAFVERHKDELDDILKEIKYILWNDELNMSVLSSYVGSAEFVKTSEFYDLNDFTISPDSAIPNYVIINGSNEMGGITVSLPDYSYDMIAYLISKSSCESVIFQGIKDENIISSLKDKTSIKYIEIQHSRIESLECISQFENLEGLSIINCPIIKDLEPLENLKNLTTVKIMGTRVEDPSPLSRLSNLNYAFLNYNKIIDPSSLANSDSLETLFLIGNDIQSQSDIDPLVRKGIIDEHGKENILEDAKNCIYSMGAYKDITTQLTVVYFDSKQQYYIEFATEAGMVVAYSLVADPISINSILYELPNCEVIRLSNIPESNTLHFGLHDQQVKAIRLDFCTMDSLSFINQLEKLEVLVISKCRGVKVVADQRYLAGFKNLKSLTIEEMGDTDLSNIQNLPNLEELILDGNVTTSFDFLNNIPTLKRVVVNNRALIKDASVFRELQEKGVEVVLMNQEIPEKETRKTLTPKS